MSATLSVDAAGEWLVPVVRAPSPNCDDRPPGTAVELVVVHGISLPPGCFGSGAPCALLRNRLDWDADPFYSQIRGLRVSSHVLIERGGRVIQLVPFHRRAWHAGVSRWRGRGSCNDFSVGIELEGTDLDPYEDAQYEALAAVLRALAGSYPRITPERVVGHCDVAPGRKTDPGSAFDWARLAGLLGGPVRGEA